MLCWRVRSELISDVDNFNFEMQVRKEKLTPLEEHKGELSPSFCTHRG